MLLKDSINYWKEYEKSKNKEFIDFSKNQKMERKFLELVKTIKNRSSGCSAKTI